MNRVPRTILVALIAASCGTMMTSALRAQSEFSSDKATSFLTVGPGIAGGASLTTSPPDGYKVVPIMSYRIAADAYYPLTPSISAALGLGFDSRGTRMRNFNNTEVYTTTRVGYFTVCPGFSFSGFFIGVNFGFPMGGTITTKGGAGASEEARSMTDAEFAKVNTLVEPRLGAVIPLMNNRNGWLALTIMGGYSLSEITDRGTVIADSDGDFHMVCGQLGVTYQFSIPGTLRK
ncbi:MAG: hypothetical protein JST22_06675 [Bacteroidetes bacterium]|nr:hypothetical protein [Bacteroidota bacterium]